MGPAMIELNNIDAGEIDLDGTVIHVLNLSSAALMDVQLRLDGREYTYTSSVPLKGYGAVLPARVREALAEGRQALVVQRGERYYLYLTPAPTAPSA